MKTVIPFLEWADKILGAREYVFAKIRQIKFSLQMLILRSANFAIERRKAKGLLVGR